MPQLTRMRTRGIRGYRARKKEFPGRPEYGIAFRRLKITGINVENTVVALRDMKADGEQFGITLDNARVKP